MLYFGNLPFAASLPHLDSCTSLHWVLRKLLQKSTRFNNSNACYVELQLLGGLLEIPDNFAKVLADTVTAVAPSDQAVRQNEAVDVHAVALYLFSQLYTRQAQRPDAKEIWPSSSGAGEGLLMQIEPSSPVRMSTKTSVAFPTNFVRQHLQQQVVMQQGVVNGFTEYVQKHAADILLLCLDDPPASQANLPEVELKPHEFDRLGFLLQTCEGCSNALSRLEPSLSAPAGTAVLLGVSAWLSLQLKEHHSRPNSPGLAGTSEIHGVCKNTVAKGPGAFPSGCLRIVDCHDATIYALAPLQCVSVSCCSDCTVVVGAVGHLLRVERCMRVQLIAACKRIYVNASHDCIFYLGVNEQPVLLGDNRFVQFAPYNTQYERLEAHMAAVGCESEPNCWDMPLLLVPDHHAAHAEHLRSPDGKGPSVRGKGGPAFSILPPEKLMPFVVPFKGAPGRLCGGPASSAALMRSDSIGASVSKSNKNGGGGGGTVFPLPPEYEAAVNKKIESVAKLRAAVKSANLPEERKREVQNVIQSYFREWLNSSGKMRQIYDLARLEKDADSANV